MTRVIAGRAKGVRLSAPRSGTRPTSDRVREALFSTLATWFGTAELSAEHHLEGIDVLDLYAGTGAVALEAASRGARRVVAVDSHTADVIRANARRARLVVEVQGSRVEGQLPTGPFDLVFVDPPYDVASAALDRVLLPLFEPGVLAPRALVVVERSRRSPAPAWPDGLDDTWRRNYGETTLHFAATQQAGES
ncbi:RsmD family RNA methyltransferase [Arachnia propionica]|uniref:16S rRNA (Guanine(966)-N(2))-methyltransferase RsmD n=1 Tax=Arachnia propionica TaxID=1750 RepID=A0A3P1WSB4_9ACTN|nr:RsmD family RNA methyltransferase [Arachnia propionica]RRD48667.1 16S rRNA (guanine(966)-N(2))-methyltransferase RsmD [Arachnia propionica]